MSALELLEDLNNSGVSLSPEDADSLLESLPKTSYVYLVEKWGLTEERAKVSTISTQCDLIIQNRLFAIHLEEPWLNKRVTDDVLDYVHSMLEAELTESPFTVSRQNIHKVMVRCIITHFQSSVTVMLEDSLPHLAQRMEDADEFWDQLDKITESEPNDNTRLWCDPESIPPELTPLVEMGLKAADLIGFKTPPGRVSQWVAAFKELCYHFLPREMEEWLEFIQTDLFTLKDSPVLSQIENAVQKSIDRGHVAFDVSGLSSDEAMAYKASWAVHAEIEAAQLPTPEDAETYAQMQNMALPEDSAAQARVAIWLLQSSIWAGMRHQAEELNVVDATAALEPFEKITMGDLLFRVDAAGEFVGLCGVDAPDIISNVQQAEDLLSGLPLARFRFLLKYKRPVSFDTVRQEDHLWRSEDTTVRTDAFVTRGFKALQTKLNEIACGINLSISTADRTLKLIFDE